jgi:SWIM/SEC-C metal-binding protein
MSKFFFQGGLTKQSDKQAEIYNTSRQVRFGTDENPAKISVQTEEKYNEILALCEENGWAAEVVFDDEAPENLKDLDTLQGIKVQPTIGKSPERNAPCPCGSGKKYKKCCA